MGMIHVYVLFQRMIFSPTFAMMIPTNFVALPGDKTTGVLLACERRVFFRFRLSILWTGDSQKRGNPMNQQVEGTEGTTEGFEHCLFSIMSGHQQLLG